MSLSAADKKKLMIVGPLGLVAVGAVVWQLLGFFAGLRSRQCGRCRWFRHSPQVRGRLWAGTR